MDKKVIIVSVFKLNFFSKAFCLWEQLSDSNKNKVVSVHDVNKSWTPLLSSTSPQKLSTFLKYGDPPTHPSLFIDTEGWRRAESTIRRQVKQCTFTMKSHTGWAENEMPYSTWCSQKCFAISERRSWVSLKCLRQMQWMFREPLLGAPLLGCHKVPVHHWGLYPKIPGAETCTYMLKNFVLLGYLSFSRN